MTIRLTQDEFDELFEEAEEQLQWDTSDASDITYKFDTQILQGWWREIDLREGILLKVNRSRPSDRLSINFPEKTKNLLLCFSLLGKVQETVPLTSGEVILPYYPGKYVLKGSGLHGNICDCSDAKTNSEIMIEIQPAILRSFATSQGGELPKNLQHLIRPSSQRSYLRSGDTQPMMATVLQQILHCPYQGIIKRTYLESKIIELIALVLDHEITIREGERKKVFFKPDQLERIHYAKEILLRDLSNPPSLEELARQAGVNDFMLKQGFRYCFGTTVFSVLRSHRLELAKQLLAKQDITVAEIAHRVGYATSNSFARAFKHQFGFSPKAHRKACR
ncbi:MAG: AraC family transcriptional regulator [Cyanobacteria bacterium P01_G01_bin.49]